ncbi:MAG TPA: transglutaminase family protein [Candidatus Limnocylindria bacterium]|jgi:transglutaminase-like putative cysteine protease|nr:transglutaminase family protein [Candidatus Limnocylindria bacterium]
MIYRVTHRTKYVYSEPVTVSHHTARLSPLNNATQQRDEFTLEITPQPSVRKLRTDYFGNRLCFFSIQQIHQSLNIIARSVVSVENATPPLPQLSPPWEQVAALFRDPVSSEVVEAYQYVFGSPLILPTPELAEYAAESFDKDAPLLVGARQLTERIYEDFKYDPVATTVSTPLGEVLKNRRGVCQDFAHVAIAALRALGLPARYVSGYLRTHPVAGQPRLTGADASHAWFSVHCPGHGWVDFDPTNNLMPRDEHIAVAYGRDFSDVSPVTGVITGGGRHKVQVAVDVEPFRPDETTDEAVSESVD